MLLSRKIFLSIFAAAAPLALVAGVNPRPLLAAEDRQEQDDLDSDDVFELTYRSLGKEKRGIIGDIATGLLEHAAHGATDFDKKLVELVSKLPALLNGTRGQLEELKVWFRAHPVKGTILVCGMGGIVFKGKTISTLLAAHIEPVSKHFSKETVSWPARGSWFVTLMVLRLFVTVAVPPLSPLFSMLVDDGMPDTQQALAMPTFLVASTLAGAAPQALDLVVSLVANRVIAPCLGKGGQGLTRRDPVSKGMVWVMNMHPFTCWIYPGMKKVFDMAREDEIDAKSLRFAAIVAILFGHVFPFAGAGVTWAAIGITPYLKDNMLAQPFGMTEDLVMVALNQILDGQPQIAQRGFFALNMALHSVTAVRSISPKLRTKATIMVAFATGIWGMLEVLEAGADPIIARELWGKFLLSMMTLQVFGMPFLAEGFSSMLEWAFDWTEVHGDNTPFVLLPDEDMEANSAAPAAAAPKAKAGGVNHGCDTPGAVNVAAGATNANNRNFREHSSARRKGSFSLSLDYPSGE